MARLENWSLCVNCDPYAPPELLSTHLVGEVYGYKDPSRHSDGKRIVTSTIVGIRSGLVVTSHGSEYELGMVNPDYDEEYPNAKEKLLATLENIK